MSGAIDGPRRIPPVSDPARVGRVREESDRRSDEERREPPREPRPEPGAPEEAPAPDPDKGRNVDYLA